VLNRHPRVGRALLALGGEPWSTKAWNVGARGEQWVGSRLDRLIPCGAAVLHDRRVPVSRANIDHIVIAPSGVWVIDTKRYRGRVESRDGRLFVADRDRSKSIAGMAWQVAAVERALDGAPGTVRPVLCFTHSDTPLRTRPFTIDGVLVTWPNALVKTIRRAGDECVSVSEISARLANRLPRATAQS
jgi:hypothetical protein